MGNQQGQNAYGGFQPQGSQISGQSFPYGNMPSGWNYPGMTPSVINNYYQQGYPSSKWPSLTNIPQQTSQVPQTNFQGSYVSDSNSFKNSQLNQIRGSQLNTNPSFNYGAGFQIPQYVDPTSINQSNLNNQAGSMGNFSNQQSGSQISQPPTYPSNSSKLQYQTPQLPQYNSQLPQQQPFNSQLSNKNNPNIPKPGSQLKSNDPSNLV